MLRSLISDGEVYLSASDITAALRALVRGYRAVAAGSCCEGHGERYKDVAEELGSIADRLDCAAIELIVMVPDVPGMDAP